jgi:hypothetical protein
MLLTRSMPKRFTRRYDTADVAVFWGEGWRVLRRGGSEACGNTREQRGCGADSEDSNTVRCRDGLRALTVSPSRYHSGSYPSCNIFALVDDRDRSYFKRVPGHEPHG